MDAHAEQGGREDIESASAQQLGTAARANERAGAALEECRQRLHALPSPPAWGDACREERQQSGGAAAAAMEGLREDMLVLASSATGWVSPPASASWQAFNAASPQWAERLSWRLQRCSTAAQLAVCLKEVEATLRPSDLGIVPGAKMYVRGGDDGEKARWIDSVVVAVWEDGGFRAQVGGDPEWLEDFSPPASIEGKRQRGRDWNPLRASSGRV